jgi:hypothetical protein
MADQMLQGYESLRRRFAALEGGNIGKPLMRALGHAAIREIALVTPVRTGNLRRSLDKDPRDVTDTSAKIHMAANYALFVEEDTRAHEITPNARKALAFSTQGIINERFGTQAKSSFRLSGSLRSGALRRFGNAAFVVVKRVHHPGTKGQHMMKRGAEKAVSSVGAKELGAVIVKAWDKAR